MHMQRTILLLSVTFLLFSCSRNDQKSDAYGNFEGTEIIVSAQVPGELMFFNIEEGEDAGRLWKVLLKRESDIKGKEVLYSKIKDILSHANISH